VPVQFIDTDWTTRSVGGSTLAAVAQTISQMEEAAKTEWFPAYTANAPDDVLTGVAVTVRTKVTMPQWSGYANASQAERDEWDRFCAALRAHEQGHLDLVTSQLSGIDERLVGHSTSDASAAWANALGELNSATIDYDSSTDHGRSQGTIIDTSLALSP
jgi:predicted secreted Zn-dependent protease